AEVVLIPQFLFGFAQHLVQPYTRFILEKRRVVVSLRRTKMLTFVTGEGMQMGVFPAHCVLDYLMQLVQGCVASYQYTAPNGMRAMEQGDLELVKFCGI